MVDRIVSLRPAVIVCGGAVIVMAFEMLGAVAPGAEAAACVRAGRGAACLASDLPELPLPSVSSAGQGALSGADMSAAEGCAIPSKMRSLPHACNTDGGALARPHC